VPRIVASLETNGTPTDDTLNNLTINNKSIDIRYVLGVLNSRLITFYLRYAVINNSILTIHLDKPYLGKIPIKMAPAMEQKEVVDLVINIMDVNEQLVKYRDKDTDKRQELVTESGKINAQIDSLVYKIYGITEKEKKAIEESLI
jgi:hypothetical protein